MATEKDLHNIVPNGKSKKQREREYKTILHRSEYNHIWARAHTRRGFTLNPIELLGVGRVE